MTTFVLLLSKKEAIPPEISTRDRRARPRQVHSCAGRPYLRRGRKLLFSVVAARANIHDPPPLTAHLNIHVFSFLSPKRVPHAGGSHFIAEYSSVKKVAFRGHKWRCLGGARKSTQAWVTGSTSEVEKPDGGGRARQPHNPTRTRVSHLTLRHTEQRETCKPPSEPASQHATLPHDAAPPMCYPRDTPVTAARRSVAS